MWIFLNVYIFRDVANIDYNRLDFPKHFQKISLKDQLNMNFHSIKVQTFGFFWVPKSPTGTITIKVNLENFY